MPSLLVVGAASRDVAVNDPRGWRLGGGVTYGALTAARLGLHVRAVIGADDAAASAWELDLLSEAGVEVALVGLRRGPVMENREAPGGRIQLVTRASDRMSVRSLRRDWRTMPAVLLAPVANELPPSWARAFPASTLVGLAWQGVFRRLIPGRAMVYRPLRRRALTDRADIALVSADDASAGGAPLRTLLGRHGQQLVVTRGERGAMHLERRGAALAARLLPALPVAHVEDATGAGDVFLAAWCSALVAGRERGMEQPWPALAVAAAVASLKVQVGRLEDLPSLEDVCRLFRRSPAAPLSRGGEPG